MGLHALKDGYHVFRVPLDQCSVPAHGRCQIISVLNWIASIVQRMCSLELMFQLGKAFSFWGCPFAEWLPRPQNGAESIRSHQEQSVVTSLCCIQLLNEEGPREGTCCLLRPVVLLWNAVLVWNVSTVVFFASVAMPLKFLLKSGVATSGLSLSVLSSLRSFCFLCSSTFASSFSLLGYLLPYTLYSYSFFFPLGPSHFTLSSMKVSKKRGKTDKLKTSDSFILTKDWVEEAFEVKCWAYDRNSVKKMDWLWLKWLWEFSSVF